MELFLATFITWDRNVAPLAGTAIATVFFGKTGENLIDLGEVLLDFDELADLDNWLGFQIGE